MDEAVSAASLLGVILSLGPLASGLCLQISELKKSDYSLFFCFLGTHLCVPYKR